jgi:hypothetical protein
MRHLGRAAGFLALLLLVSGCRVLAPITPSPVSVGGLPIGDRADCSGGSCARFIEFATSTLVPWHPDVVSAEVFVPDFRGPTGEHIMMQRSGGRTLVVVLTLTGGGKGSVYVGCGVGINTDMCFEATPPSSAELGY